VVFAMPCFSRKHGRVIRYDSGHVRTVLRWCKRIAVDFKTADFERKLGLYFCSVFVRP